MSESGCSPTCSRDSTPAAQTLTPDKSVSPSTADAVPLDQVVPEVIKLSRSMGAKALDKYHTEGPNGMFFSTYKDAAAAVNHVQWHPPANDGTIPKTAEEDRLVVRRLVGAFMELKGAMDTPENAYRKRFTPGTNVFYLPWTVERCAWEILAMVKSIHTEGFKAPITDIDILKCIGQTEHWTFETRIDMICRVLKLSKSVAVSLMKQEKAWTVIGAPHKLHNSTLVNTQSNAHRNKWVKAGRQAEKGHPVLPRSKKEDQAAKKQKTSHEYTPHQGSATFAPSPLANAVSSTTNHTASLSSTTPAAEDDVQMVDVVAEKAVEEKTEENKVEGLDTKFKSDADMKTEEKIKAAIKANIDGHLKANPKPKPRISTPAFFAPENDNNSNTTVTDVATNYNISKPPTPPPTAIPRNSATTPQATTTYTTATTATTASADLDAAQLLLGLGRKA